MVEANAVYDPFAAENVVSGGGLWDGKIVTITGRKTQVDYISKRNASGELEPYIDQKTGKQAFRNVLEVTGIAEDEEKERRETYSAGGLIPTADGLGFESSEPGKPAQIHKNSELFKFGAALKAGGYDTTKLFVDGKINFGNLLGARIKFKGEDVMRDGKPKKNDKGYTQQKFWPAQYVGHSTGSGNGAVATDEVRAKASAAVLSALTASGGTLTRADLVRKLSSTLNGSPDTNAIIQLVIKDEFHENQPWKRDGSVYQLTA